ncbi:polyprenol dehydrogenase isoform X2 [Notamacropus eugenii]|uniref:polyprenol dehydrogenase isoform X2 n=1 Tax=Notamacropus eugenii TaxID=9315 RepID=UPI003B677D6E
MHVIIAGNNEKDAQEAVKRIKEETLTSKVEFLFCDLASMKSVRQFVKEFKKKNYPLHVLINNAGVMMIPQRKNIDGFEEHFAVNYLGHFLLTNLLLDVLKKTGSPSRNARVVTVSSSTHYVGELNMDDLQSRHCYSPCGAYAQSKLALVLFSYQLQQLLAAEGSHVTVNVVDPGVVNSDLYKHVFWLLKLVKNLTYWFLFKILRSRQTRLFTTFHVLAQAVSSPYKTTPQYLSFTESLAPFKEQLRYHLLQGARSCIGLFSFLDFLRICCFSSTKFNLF